LNLFKKIFAKYSAWLLHALSYFGVWGVFVIAFTDSVVPVIPIDPIIGGYVYRDPHRMWFYILMASVGCTLGSLVPFFIGRAGGELFLLKRIDQARLESLQHRYEKQEFFFIAIPSMMPPPTPLKLIQMSAGAFRMPLWLFVASTMAGRILRFTILSILVVKFGPQIVQLFLTAVTKHLAAVLIIVGLVILGFVLRHFSRRKLRRA
jgi:membrane protein YqaA with SNARE-associated domain